MTGEALTARLLDLPRLIRDEEEALVDLTAAQARAEAQAVLDGQAEEEMLSIQHAAPRGVHSREGRGRIAR